MWNSLVSTVEAEVIKLFEDKAIINTNNKKPQQPDSVELINKLISEYMDWMGYNLTYSMFAKGSNKIFEINLMYNLYYSALLFVLFTCPYYYYAYL